MTELSSASFRVVIPARYESSRLPGKPLRLIAGRPMIEHVYRKAQASGAEAVIIATDDERIYQAAQQFGADVCMTASSHETGTDRIAEVVAQRGWPKQTLVVNLQGDEPLMPPSVLQQVAGALAKQPAAGMATLCTRITDAAVLVDPNVVKVILNRAGFALYFSRAVIPHHRGGDSAQQSLGENIAYYHHFGIYAYRADVLCAYSSLPRGELEHIEALEQLRALWNGIAIYVEEVEAIPHAGVDTAEDLARVEALLAAEV